MGREVNAFLVETLLPAKVFPVGTSLLANGLREQARSHG